LGTIAFSNGHRSQPSKPKDRHQANANQTEDRVVNRACLPPNARRRGINAGSNKRQQSRTSAHARRRSATAILADFVDLSFQIDGPQYKINTVKSKTAKAVLSYRTCSTVRSLYVLAP